MWCVVYYSLATDRACLTRRAADDVAPLALEPSVLQEIRGQSSEGVVVNVELLQELQIRELRRQGGELVLAQVQGLQGEQLANLRRMEVSKLLFSQSVSSAASSPISAGMERSGCCSGRAARGS